MRNAIFAALAMLTWATAASAQFSSSSSSLPSTSVQPLLTVENHLLYHPKTAGESWHQLPLGYRVEDVWLRSADGQQIHAWWFPQPQSTGAILLCHGNAGNLSHCSGRVLKLQRALGQSVLVFDYPGYGKSSGKPSEAGCYASADAAYEWLTTVQGLPAQKITLYGESLGGGVATELAVRRRARALVLVRTFTCVPDVVRKAALSSAAPLVHNRFDNLARIPHCTMPIFIAHGAKDFLIPLAQAVKLFEAAPQPKRAHLLKNLGHNDDLPPDFYAALADFERQAAAWIPQRPATLQGSK